MTYLDHSATSPMRPEARRALDPWLAADRPANPSSAHGAGQRARRALNEAGETLAACLGASPRELIWTSGGTEADNLALRGAWESPTRPPERRRLVVSAVEHPAVLAPARGLAAAGAEVTVLPVGPSGRVEPEVLDEVLGPDVFLVSVMAVNNETGVMQPVRELAELSHAAGALFHTDAVQAPARVPVDLAGWGVDLASFSGHKPGGPVGIGALYMKDGAAGAPLLLGGAQQGGRRPGTEPVGLAVAMAAAFRALDEGGRARLRELDSRLTAGLGEFTLHGDAVHRAPGIVSLGRDGLDGEALAMALDLRGIRVSTGAACASGAREPSPVLTAMGVPAGLVRGSIRVSLGWSSTPEDVDELLQALPEVLEDLRAAEQEGWA